MILAALLAAAPLDARSELQALRTQDSRVATVAYALATANVDLCTRRTGWTGLVVHALGQYAPGYRDAAIAEFGFVGPPAIEVVVPGSPADRAGLRANDSLRFLNDVGFDLPPPAGPFADYQAVAGVRRNLESAARAGRFDLTVIRAGSQLTFHIVPEPGCASAVQVETSRHLNAEADGTTISITSRAAEAAENPSELAILIAHELAHNLLRHRAALDCAAVSRGLLGHVGASARRIRETEDEADRLGLYLAARAGFDITAAPAIWTRLGEAKKLGFLADATHASPRDRSAAATRTLAEIAALKASGRPLTPPPDLAAPSAEERCPAGR